jgi:hypothetical protein
MEINKKPSGMDSAQLGLPNTASSNPTDNSITAQRIAKSCLRSLLIGAVCWGLIPMGLAYWLYNKGRL